MGVGGSEGRLTRWRLRLWRRVLLGCSCSLPTTRICSRHKCVWPYRVLLLVRRAVRFLLQLSCRCCHCWPRFLCFFNSSCPPPNPLLRASTGKSQPRDLHRDPRAQGRTRHQAPGIRHRGARPRLSEVKNATATLAANAYPPSGADGPRQARRALSNRPWTP
jgi:hypothetical protein